MRRIISYHINSMCSALARIEVTSQLSLCRNSQEEETFFTNIPQVFASEVHNFCFIGSFYEDWSNEDAHPRKSQSSVDTYPLLLTVPVRILVHLYRECCSWNLCNIGGERLSSHFTPKRWYDGLQDVCFGDFKVNAPSTLTHAHTFLTGTQIQLPRVKTVSKHSNSFLGNTVEFSCHKKLSGKKPRWFYSKPKANTLADKISTLWGHWLFPLHRAHKPTVNSSGIKVPRPYLPLFTLGF